MYLFFAETSRLLVQKLHAQACPALSDLIDCSPPGSSVHGILQARILEVGSCFLLQGIFMAQALKPHLLHGEVDSLPLSHLGSQTNFNRKS